MLFFGILRKTTLIKKGEFSCPNCIYKCTYSIYNKKKYIHIFFIPVHPIEDLGNTLICNNCRSAFDPQKIDFNKTPTIANTNTQNIYNEKTNLLPATIGLRIGAFLVDSLIMLPFGFLYQYLKINYLAFFISFFYFYFCDIIFNGSSIGKLIFKIKLSEVYENKLPSNNNLIIRNLIKGIFIFFPFIYLIALTNNKLQSLHDIAAKTIVIDK